MTAKLGFCGLCGGQTNGSKYCHAHAWAGGDPVALPDVVENVTDRQKKKKPAALPHVVAKVDTSRPANARNRIDRIRRNT